MPIQSLEQSFVPGPFFLREIVLDLAALFTSSFVVFALLVLLLFLRPIVNNISPCLTSLNKEIASWCVIP